MGAKLQSIELTVTVGGRRHSLSLSVGSEESAKFSSAELLESSATNLAEMLSKRLKEIYG